MWRWLRWTSGERQVNTTSRSYLLLFSGLCSLWTETNGQEVKTDVRGDGVDDWPSLTGLICFTLCLWVNEWLTDEPRVDRTSPVTSSEVFSVSHQNFIFCQNQVVLLRWRTGWRKQRSVRAAGRESRATRAPGATFWGPRVPPRPANSPISCSHSLHEAHIWTLARESWKRGGTYSWTAAWRHLAAQPRHDSHLGPRTKRENIYFYRNAAANVRRCGPNAKWRHCGIFWRHFRSVSLATRR